jgi:hypothetical protein
LSRGERWFIAAGIAFGLLATICYLTNPLGVLAPEHPITRAVVLVGNRPGFLLAIIPFALLGGFHWAHGGEAEGPTLLVLFVGNPIGWGVLARLLISLGHRHRAEPNSIES